MNSRATYRRLEWASFTIFLIIAITIGLLFSETVSLKIFKVSLVVLLLIAFAMLLLLRRSITDTIRQGKQRFKNAEYKFEKLFESDVIGIVISSYPGIILEANDAFLKITGYSQADLTQAAVRWDNLTPPEFIVEFNKSFKELKTLGYHQPYEKQIIRKDGTRVWVLCGSAALYDSKEGTAVTYTIDITLRKDAEHQAAEYEKIIKTQQEEFTSVFMNAPAFISIRRGPELRYVFVNKAIASISGRNNHLGKTHQEVYDDAVSQQDWQTAYQVYETGKPVKGTGYKIDYKNDQGEPRFLYLDYMVTPVFDCSGKVDGVAFFGNDITELVTANQEMEVSKNKFAFLADTMPHKVWMTNAEGELQYLNKVWMEYLDIRSVAESGAQWIESKHPDEIELIENAWKQSLINGTELHIETRLRRSDGEFRWHLTHAVPFKDAQGGILYWVGINTDIHDQKMQLQHLRDNEAYFRDLSEETPFIVWKSDQEGNCVYLNKKWTEFTGLSLEESLGEGYKKAILFENPEAYRQNWSETLKNRSLYQRKFRLKNVDGTYHWVFSQANPHYLNSDFDGYVGSMVDITEQELRSQALKELSDKKDEFLSIASHELKTPLTSIKASIQLISRTIPADNKVGKFAAKASEQILRLERLIADLLDASKINSGRLVYNNTVFYFREMLREVVQSIQHTTQTHQIIIERSDKVIFLGDRFRIEQVIYNFLSNAIKYSPEANKVIVVSEVKENNLVVSVQDYGIGIAREDLHKTFDRYYRVDDMRFQGLGLGLFISAEILKRHNGSFWIESEPGKGSTFFFSLPLTDPAQAEDPETDNQTFYKDGKVDILYNPVKNWLETRWHGFQNLETIKRGCAIMLDLLEKNFCTKVLNDNTHVLGNWTDASEWGAKVWLPAMEHAGLRYFAWVHSGSTFSRLAANKIAGSLNGQVDARFFEQRDEAIYWLENIGNPDSVEDTGISNPDTELV